VKYWQIMLVISAMENASSCAEKLTAFLELESAIRACSEFPDGQGNSLKP